MDKNVQINSDQIQKVEILEGQELLEDVYELEFNPEDLHESKDGKKKPYLKGTFGLVDTATANKRLYTRRLMERELSRLKDDMEAHKVYGEIDHPKDGKTMLSRASHFVTGAEIKEDGKIKGVIEFIPGTRGGDQALAIARAGGKLGVSSRGFGSTVTDHKGNLVVQEDYRLVTWDVVADPANAGAHPDFVMEHKERTDMNMDLDGLKKEYPELVKELQTEMDVAARTHARDALREEFQTQLREEGIAIREEAIDVARSELENDPEVAGAVSALAAIKEVLMPFLFAEDENIEISQLQDRVQMLERKIANQDEALSTAVAEQVELAAIAKELGFHLYLERFLGDNERADQIEEMVGDVTGYASLEELRDRTEEIVHALSEEDVVREQYEERIARLEKVLVLTESQRDKALAIGRKFGVKAYIEHKIANHPKAPSLREYVTESGAKTKEDVDRACSAFDKANPVSREFTRIRSGIFGDQSAENFKSKKERSINEDVDVMGVSMTELKSRSGIATI